MRKLLVIGWMGFCLTASAWGQVQPERLEAVADTWSGISGNYPDDPVLRVGKHGFRRDVARLRFDLDTTVSFFSLDCNFWSSIAAAELVLEIEEVQGCRGGGCKLRVFREGPGPGHPLSPPVRVRKGQSGEVRFDITHFVSALDDHLTPRLRIVQQNSGGAVLFRSLESTTGDGPRIEVTNHPISDDTQVARHQQAVFGEVMSYLEAGDPDSPNQFLLIHGMPSYSILYRNVIPILAEVGHVVAPDWVGTGFSSFPSPATFSYDFDDQADHLAELVRQLGLTDDGRKLIVVIHEVGGLGGFHYVTTHQEKIAGVAFYETWLDVCPDAYEGSATNPPPPDGLGVCQKDTLVPFELFPLWETAIYPSEALTCASLTPILLSPDTLQSFTVRPLSPALLDAYLAPYELTPDCSLVPGPLSFPRHIPVPVPGEPAGSRQLYDDYLAIMRTWEVPKLFLVGDPGGGFNLVFDEQLPYVFGQYPNLTAGCIGRAGHFGPEDVPFNTAETVLRWAVEEGLAR